MYPLVYKRMFLLGSTSLMLQCYKDLLGLHDYFIPKHSTISIKRILNSALGFDTLSSRGSFLHLQMALNMLSTQEVSL